MSRRIVDALSSRVRLRWAGQLVLAATWGGVLAAACGGAPAARPTSGSPPPVAPSAPTAVSDAGVTEASAPAVPSAAVTTVTLERIEPLEQAGCTIRNGQEDDWFTQVTLRLRSGGPVWARASFVNAVLSVPVKDESARLEITDEALWVIGVVDPADVQLALRKGRTLGPILPKPGARLRYVRATTSGTVRLSLAPTGALRPAGGGRFEWDERCDLVSMATHEYDARRSAKLAPKAPEQFLKGGAPVRLTASHDGGDAVDVEVEGNGDLAVEVHGRRGKLVKIVSDHSEELVAGWVPASAIKPHSDDVVGIGAGYGSGRGVMGGRHPYVRCERDAELAVGIHGERRVVGRLKAGGALFEKPASDGTKRLEFGGRIDLLPEARLEIVDREAAGCRLHRR